MTPASFGDVLHHLEAAYRAHPEMMKFAPFPDDVMPQPLDPFHIPSVDLLRREVGLKTDTYLHELADALIAAAGDAKWRETYKGTDIGQDFMDRFGCYNIIGEGGAFMSKTLWAYVTYMPPHLHYTWHNHPAEELYLVVAGRATFMKEGAVDAVLGPGQTAFHASNQPHAMETGDDPVMCIVLWRNCFDTPPVLTNAEADP